MHQILPFPQPTWPTAVVSLQGPSPPHTQLLEVVGEAMGALSSRTSRLLIDATKDSALHLLRPLLRQSHRYGMRHNKELARVKLFFLFSFKVIYFFFCLVLYVVASLYFFFSEMMDIILDGFLLFLIYWFMSVRRGVCACISKFICYMYFKVFRELLGRWRKILITNMKPYICHIRECFVLYTKAMINMKQIRMKVDR